MKLVWKLLRQHISLGQLMGFFFANLFGMVIILLSVQFYKDVKPLFDGGDSFMKKDFLIVSKKVNALGGILRKDNTFTNKEIDELQQQPFVGNLGMFTPSQFKVYAGMGMKDTGLRMSTDMFFESVPDEYVDTNLDKWKFTETDSIIPIIIPRNYLNLYNFGFAQSRNLPQLSEGLMGLIQMDIYLSGNGQSKKFKGYIAGFSNRLNTILVPQSFMDWANESMSSGKTTSPSRLIVETTNPADASIASYFQEKGYEVEDGKLDAGKTTYFLRLIVGIVIGVGAFISILSFYILILSIYLLLQKNTTKLENLLLMGYTPQQVALPYQTLTTLLNILILFLSIVFVVIIRRFYLNELTLIFPQMEIGGIYIIYIIGILLFLAVSLFNILLIRKKIIAIWIRK